MRISKKISFTNFKNKTNTKNLDKILKKILSEKNEILDSLKPNYKYSFNKKLIDKYKNKNLRLIGMGGSILGMKAIYNFLKKKIRNKIYFVDNLDIKIKDKSAKPVNIIISKSGNTLETIVNSNLIIKKNKKNIFITEKKNSYLRELAIKLKAEIIDHNNFIGGRYSVLSEVGMLPSSLVGLDEKKFKQFNKLVNNKTFINTLMNNVANIYKLVIKKKYNSVILNYDKNSDDLFRWYQQLVAESLGKKNKGILPIISTMPKDNHSVMQLYLDGNKNNFFTFFNVIEKKSEKMKKNQLQKNFEFLNNKNLYAIINSQKIATENVFSKKKLPFRSILVNYRDEESIGELFTFFILETILLGKLMKINPYDQPAVELIKKETFKLLN